MSDGVKRHYPTETGKMNEVPNGILDSSIAPCKTYVLASDYDALEKRLEEAEKLNRKWVALLQYNGILEYGN